MLEVREQILELITFKNQLRKGVYAVIAVPVKHRNIESETIDSSRDISNKMIRICLQMIFIHFFNSQRFDELN